MCKFNLYCISIFDDRWPNKFCLECNAYKNFKELSIKGRRDSKKEYKAPKTRNQYLKAKYGCKIGVRSW